MDTWAQSKTLAAVVAVGLATIVLADLAVRSTSIAAWVDARRVERARRMNWQYEYAGRFLNADQRLLLEELPEARYSAGSVCFVGSSVMKAAIFLNGMSPAERALIENYSWDTAVHSQQLAFVRYLVEDHGLLAAGGERTLVVIGLFYGSTANDDRRTGSGYFKEMLAYEGLYTYSPEDGMHEAPLGPFERSLRIEHGRLHQSVVNALRHWDAGLLPPAGAPAPVVYGKKWRDYMGPSWQSEMRTQVARLGEMVDYLRKRNVVVAGVVLPLASWQRALPFPGELRSLVDPMFQDKGVPILDLTELDDDADFGDSAHVTMRGEIRSSDILLGLARSHLRRTGALRPCSPDAVKSPVAHRAGSGLEWGLPAGAKGLLVWRPDRSSASEPVEILAGRATSYALAERTLSAPYVVEAFDAQGCSSQASGDASP